MGQTAQINRNIMDRAALRLIRSLYGLTPTTMEILWKLLGNERPITVEELIPLVGVPKVSIALSLKRLYELGLVERRQRRSGTTKRGKGRFQFEYYVNRSKLLERIWNDMEEAYQKLTLNLVK
ncbi:helix-turn-helix domain-containing protein [Metallosphaera javensis (ex Sakai et al. 2022)]|uniref:helix-turn-helix domain-containing protein n=1 Tax=Metallosphaera javensis (ex Sakai et al. 2022) TaxID=2775498 RepID=UPI00258D00DA|nr:MAG: transcriptional regulator [Metallosphaera javensis (ex Sakai et al. 2022)]